MSFFIKEVLEFMFDFLFFRVHGLKIRNAGLNYDYQLVAKLFRLKMQSKQLTVEMPAI